jgi:hypothetical protein
MKNKLECKVKDLSSHLKKDLFMFTGKTPMQTPRIRLRQLLPVLVLLVTTVAVASSKRARNSVAVKLLMFFSTRLLQQKVV